MKILKHQFQKPQKFVNYLLLNLELPLNLGFTKVNHNYRCKIRSQIKASSRLEFYRVKLRWISWCRWWGGPNIRDSNWIYLDQFFALNELDNNTNCLALKQHNFRNLTLESLNFRHKCHCFNFSACFTWKFRQIEQYQNRVYFESTWFQVFLLLHWEE